MKVLIAGGGTGGHIYPALAIAEEIKGSFGAEILYIGSRTGLENDIVPKAGFDLKTIPASGLERKLSPKNIKALWQTLKGYWMAKAILGEFRPDLVVGTGGYVCGPVLLAAARKGIPTLIHEQNAFPGITNRILSRYVDVVAVTFEESVHYFKDQRKVHVTGLPVRREILEVKRARDASKVKPIMDRFLILSFGGSRGAASINKAMVEVIDKLRDHPNVQILHITGTLGHEDFLRVLRKRIGEIPENVSVVSYLYDMPATLASANLVISRAGAATIAELTVLGTPSILIPYPYAAENHQEYNARALSGKGAAEIILDRNLSGDTLVARVEELIKDSKRLQRMALNCAALGRPGALQDILKCIEKIV